MQLLANAQVFSSRTDFAAAVKRLPHQQFKIGASRVNGVNSTCFVRYVCQCSKKCKASVRAVPVNSIDGEWVVTALKLEHEQVEEQLVDRSLSSDYLSSTEDFDYQPPAKRMRMRRSSRSPSFAFETVSDPPVISVCEQAYDTPATSVYNDGYASSDLSELSCGFEHLEHAKEAELPVVGTVFPSRQVMQQTCNDANLNPDKYSFTTLKSRTSKDIFQVDYGCTKGKKGRAGFTGCQCKITVHCVGPNKWIVVKSQSQHNHGSAQQPQPIIRVFSPEASTSQAPFERPSSPLSDLDTVLPPEHSFAGTAATRILPRSQWKPRSAKSLKMLHLIAKGGYASMRTTLQQQGRDDESGNST